MNSSAEELNLSVPLILERVREHGLIAVALDADPAEDDSSFWPFKGSISEFLAIVKELGSKAVYVVAYTFDESWFSFSPEKEDEDEWLEDEQEEDEGVTKIDDAPENIDLVEVDPRFELYKARIGEPHAISLFALTDESKLFFEIKASWYNDFSSLYESTTTQLMESTVACEKVSAVAREKRLEAERGNMIQALERLPTDARFRDLRTKGAMTAYVNEHFPRAKELLGAGNFRDKLTDLHHRAQLERSRR
jgi:hypothetical protein